MKLNDYQQKALNNLIDASEQLFSEYNGNRLEITLKAPTASGKTVIMGEYITQILGDRHFMQDEDLVIVWTSIGRGSLHQQSLDSFERQFQGSFNCYKIENVFDRQRIENNSLIVANWEKVNSPTNTVRVTTEEKFNIDRLFEKCGLKKILIIDESHHSSETDNAQNFIDAVNPCLIIKVSATPKEFGNDIQTVVEDGEGIYVSKRSGKGYVLVTYAEAKSEGMIKQSIKLNDIVKDSGNYINEHERYLEASIERMDSIKTEYSKLKIGGITPLCLIQIPDSRVGAETREIVENYLQTQELLEKTAVWLSEETKPVDIEKLDSNIEYLIFKQAIATGWDCPRAHILVKFRERGTETFDLQTLGRIMRTAERKKYKNEILDNGYLYTNHDVINDIVDSGEDEKKNIKDLTCFLKEEYFMALPTIIGSIVHKIDSSFDSNIITLELSKALKNNFAFTDDIDYNCNKWHFNNLGNARARFNTGNIDAKEIDARELTSDDFDKIEYQLGSREVERKFSKQMYDKFRNNSAIISRCYFGALRYLFGINRNDIDDVEKSQLFFVKYSAMIIESIKQTLDAIKPPKQSEDFTFEFINQKNYSSEIYELFPANKYMYNKCYLQKGRSKPEKVFETLLDKNSDVKCWYKNGEGSSDFTIVYNYKGDKHPTFPDFIVLMNDGSLCLYETKVDDEESKKTDAKHEALKEYEFQTGIKTDVVLVDVQNGIAKSYYKQSTILFESEDA